MKTNFTFLISLFFSLTINAQIYVKHDASGNNSGTSWQDAYTNPQDAFDNAGPNDQIWIAVGIYKPQSSALSNTNTFWVNHPIEIYGGFAGTETMLAERDWINNVTTFSGDILGDDVDNDFNNFRSDNSLHVMRVESQIGIIIIDGLTISNGQTRIDEIPMSTVDYSPWRGGGIEIIAEAEIKNCIIKQCDGNAGSAFWAISTLIGSNVLVENSTFENNRSQQGAMVYLSMNDPILRRCHFENNMSTTFGGGITLGNTNALVEDCTFQSNSAPNSVGGGIFIYQNSFNLIPTPTIEIRRSEFSNNDAFAGGGLTFNNFFAGSQIIIDSCNFFQNISPENMQGGGGGILLQNFQDNFGGGIPSLNASVTNNTLSENSGDDGGGAFFYSQSDTMNLELINNEFNTNNATFGGGAINILNSNTFINATIHNNTFAENTSGFGGGAIALGNNGTGPRINYDINECIFTENQSNYCGAIWSTLYADSEGCIGKISNSSFIENFGSHCCGAVGFLDEETIIDNTTFTDNATTALEPILPGGGAAYFRFVKNAVVTNSTFTGNSSDLDGAAIMIQEGERVRLENVLMTNNVGNSTISNEDSLWMINVTMDANDFGILQKDSSYLKIQNSIFNNLDLNYQQTGTTEVITRGGNISSDNTLSTFLTGNRHFSDYNETDPLLGTDFVPEQNSLAIDNGNRYGINSTLDLAGNDRIQGQWNQIDIGAFETPFTTSLEDLELLGITVYPNPFIDNINISDVQNIDAIKLLDISGKEIQSFPIKNNLSISKHLPKGIYFLEIEIQNRSYLKKIEKQ